MEKLGCDCNIIHIDIVEKLKKTMPKQQFIDNMSNFFKILGDQTRVKIMWLLNKNELCVCDIAHLLNKTKSATSHQIKVLRQANLIKGRRSGKEIYYTLSDNHIEEIFETTVCHLKHC